MWTSAQQLPYHRYQRPEGLASVADRVLLRRGQFRAGDLVAHAAGGSGRSRSRSCPPARGGGCPPCGLRPLVPCRPGGRGPPRRRSGRRGVRPRCRTAGPGAGSGWRGRLRGCPPSGRRRCRARRSGRRRRGRSRRRRPARPVAWARAWALRRAFSAKVTPVSLTSGISGYASAPTSSRSRPASARIAWSSVIFPGLRVARIRRVMSPIIPGCRPCRSRWPRR